MLRTLVKSVAIRSMAQSMLARSALSQVPRTAMFSSVASKKLSAALKKEFEQEADVLSGDYYEAENGIVKDYLKAHSEWKVWLLSQSPFVYC